MDVKKTVFWVSLAVFTTESVVNYNMGSSVAKDEPLTIKFPPFKEFIKIVGIVLLFSYINSIIISSIHKAVVS